MQITVDRENFRNAIAAVALAMNADATRANQHGIVLEAADEGRALDIVATNGYWLARWREPVLAGSTASGRVMLHASAVPTLRAWLKTKAKHGVIAIDFAGKFVADQETHPFSPVDADPPRAAAIFAAVEPEPVVEAPRAVSIAGRYVAAIVKAFAYAGAQPIFRFGDELDAVLVRARYCPLTCIVMPVASEDALRRAAEGAKVAT